MQGVCRGVGGWCGDEVYVGVECKDVGRYGWM